MDTSLEVDEVPCISRWGWFCSLQRANAMPAPVWMPGSSLCIRQGVQPASSFPWLGQGSYGARGRAHSLKKPGLESYGQAPADRFLAGRGATQKSPGLAREL